MGSRANSYSGPSQGGAAGSGGVSATASVKVSPYSKGSKADIRSYEKVQEDEVEKVDSKK